LIVREMEVNAWHAEELGICTIWDRGEERAFVKKGL
jgi:hypothetical protein